MLCKDSNSDSEESRAGSYALLSLLEESVCKTFDWFINIWHIDPIRTHFRLVTYFLLNSVISFTFLVTCLGNDKSVIWTSKTLAVIFPPYTKWHFTAKCIAMYRCRCGPVLCPIFILSWCSGWKYFFFFCPCDIMFTFPLSSCGSFNFMA